MSLFLSLLESAISYPFRSEKSNVFCVKIKCKVDFSDVRNLHKQELVKRNVNIAFKMIACRFMFVAIDWLSSFPFLCLAFFRYSSNRYKYQTARIEIQIYFSIFICH